MIRWLRAVFGLAVLAVVVAVSAYGGWRWGDGVFLRLESWVGARASGPGDAAGPEPGPELAQATMERVDAFRSDGGEGAASELSLGNAEVSSVVRYGAPGVLPPGVARPDIELASGQLRISSRVAVAEVPSVPELERVLGILPDTVPVSLEASLVPFGSEGAALVVHRMRAAGIPLPRRVIPAVLEALGREDRPGLPPDAITLPLPAGVRSAYILSDSLVLVAARD